MRINVLTELKSLADENYHRFTAKLLPLHTKLLGVRVPKLRAIIKKLQKQGREAQYLNISPNDFEYHEELLVYAGLAAQFKTDFTDKLRLVKNFVPCINNWAVCDMFCADFKEVKKAPETWYEALHDYTKSKAEYEIRVFYVLALNYFITPALFSKVLADISTQSYVGFYDKMAVAWYLSVAYVHYPESIENFLLNTELDKFVFNKTINKICDSFRINKEAKIRLRTLASAKHKSNTSFSLDKSEI